MEWEGAPQGGFEGHSEEWGRLQGWDLERSEPGIKVTTLMSLKVLSCRPGCRQVTMTEASPPALDLCSLLVRSGKQSGHSTSLHSPPSPWG